MPATPDSAAITSVDVPASLLDILVQAQRVVVFTGAGVSAESGISTFRDGNDGLWARFNPQELATQRAFRANPARVWGWYEARRAAIRRATPNPGHHAIAGMARHFDALSVVTQNVDDLHERAGSKDVRHLHGRLEQARCDRCNHPYPHAPEVVDAPEAEMMPPSCTRCAGLVRPGVVWFGEGLPEREWDAALRQVHTCEVLLSVGTSALVYPAAELPNLAKSRGATVVQVNPNPTDLDKSSDFNLRGQAGVVLPAVLAALDNAMPAGRQRPS